MAKRTRKMGHGKNMSKDDMSEEDDSTEEDDKMARGGMVKSKNSGLQQVSGFKFSGTY